MSSWVLRFFIAMLSTFVLSVIMLSVIMLSVIMQNVIMLSVAFFIAMLSTFVLSVIMLGVIMLSVIMCNFFLISLLEYHWWYSQNLLWCIIVSQPWVKNNICWNAFIQWCGLFKSISFYIKQRQVKTERGIGTRARERERGAN